MNSIFKINTLKYIEFKIIIIFILLVSISISNVLNRNLYSEKYNENFEKIFSFQQYHIKHKKLAKELNNYQKEYNCEIKNNLDERHRLRWLGQLFWLKVYEVNTFFFGKTKFAFDLHKILIGLIIFSSYLSIVSLFQKEKDKNIIFPLSGIFVFFFLIISNSNVSEINFSILEFFFLSIAFFSIFRRIKWLIILVVILSPMNRETGFILPLIYLIFYPRDLKFFFFVTIASVLIYISVNYSSIKCIFTPGFLFTTEPAYQKFSEIPTIERTKILIQDYLFYIIVLILYWKNNLLQNKFLLILGIYLVSFILGAPFQHSIIKILFIPTLMLYVYSGISKNLKITN